MKSRIASASASSLSSEIVDLGGVSFLAKTFDNMGRGDLLKVGDTLKANRNDYLFFLVGKSDEGIALTAFGGGEGAKRLGAGNAIRLAAPLLGGNGGGKPEMAQGSAKDLTRLDEAIAAIKAKLA